MAGCGENRPFDSVVVAGSVSFQGQPVNNGEIRFYPVAGTQGPVSGGPIVNGKYEVTSKGGVPIGSHVVRIQAFGGSGRLDQTVPEEVADDFASDAEQLLPAKYNRDSQLTATITGDDDPQELNFNLD